MFELWLVDVLITASEAQLVQLLTPVRISSCSRLQISPSLGSNRSRRRRQDKEEEQVNEWQRSCELILTSGRVSTPDCSTTLTF